MIPDSEIIIIGGGAVGCGVAYALAKAGQTQILVLERTGEVGQVTTSQGAGLCGQVRDSVERIHLAMHSVATFREMQQDPEVRPDWHEARGCACPERSRSASMSWLRSWCRRSG